MSSTEIIERTSGRDTDEPEIAHLVAEDGDLVALCGTHLKGIPAAENDELCVVCEDLWELGL